MAGEIAVKGGDITHLKEVDFGQKAVRLLQLGYWSVGQEVFHVPEFAIASAQASREFYESAGAPPVVDYGALPEANVTAGQIANFFNGFYRSNLDLFEECKGRLGASDRSIYIGSSVVVEDATRLSFAGVNWRTTPRMVPQVGKYAETAVQRALSGLFRPYAEMYLRAHRAATCVRPAAIMFYEYIDADAEAVAYVHSDFVYIEWKPLQAGSKRRPPKAHFALSGSPCWGPFWADNHRGERVLHAITEIMSAACRPASEIAEFEFCFTRDDDLYFLQYRSYPIPRAHRAPLSDSDATAPILGSVATTRGRPLSLLDADVTSGAAEMVVREQTRPSDDRPMWLVRRDGPGWDAFRLLWLAHYFRLPPIQLVMCYSGETHPMHLTSVLREDPRIAFFGECSYEALRPYLDEATLHVGCNGFTCQPLQHGGSDCNCISQEVSGVLGRD